MKINLLDVDSVIPINELVCKEGGNPFLCNDSGKVESALHAAYYPGSGPFRHGGVGTLAGAMAFYICQAHAFVDGNKRTGALAAITF